MKHAILKRSLKSIQSMVPTQEKQRLQEGKEQPFYETYWFWVCLTIIIICITRPVKVIICGNGNGNFNGLGKK